MQPRAIGAAMVSVSSDVAGITRLSTLRNSGSLKLVFPHCYSAGKQAILVNTAGGVTGGDRFSTIATVQTGAALTITTQAAERAYRAQPGEVGQVTTTLDVGTAAHLAWLPQELILFDRSALNRRLDITLGDDAQLLMVEPIVFGRHAMGETLDHIRFSDRISVMRAEKPLFLDGISLQGDAEQHLRRRAIANGARAIATILMVHPLAAAHLAKVRAMLPATSGASLIAPDALLIRMLASDGFALRQSLVPLLEYLSDDNLPTSWRL